MVVVSDHLINTCTVNKKIEKSFFRLIRVNRGFLVSLGVESIFDIYWRVSYFPIKLLSSGGLWNFWPTRMLTFANHFVASCIRLNWHWCCSQHSDGITSSRITTSSIIKLIWPLIMPLVDVTRRIFTFYIKHILSDNIKKRIILVTGYENMYLRITNVQTP